MERPRSVTVIASLALVQGILGVLVGLVWLLISNIFDQEGGAMSSLIAMTAEVRGWSRIILSLLYILFAVGAWQARPWAWWVGLLVPASDYDHPCRKLSQGRINRTSPRLAHHPDHHDLVSALSNGEAGVHQVVKIART